MSQIQEQNAWKTNGFLFLLIDLLLLAGSLYSFAVSNIPLAVIGVILFIFVGFGFLVVQPNQGYVLTFFGKYIGSVREDGFYWVNPLATKKKISLRVRNFNSEKIKVNDAEGNPIEIGAVVVWRVIDSAKAVLDMEDVEEFVDIQSETAIRSIASRYPYDSHDKDIESLQGNPDEVSHAMQYELQERLKIAGVEILEARISHLAYAPEIAQAMLRRQQAQAIIAARQKIVEGAMGMVTTVLKDLEAQGVVDLDEERKASMANNLLVALVSDSGTTPVINTGSLYT
ncbi:SPFH domain / Band 7 family protein [Thermoflavimicrobium dichotomicum]|uniref:SPFH domain / Band 7 family protein n=1 Tax=Thermoflavimicrobium dichotomicum TaxID=46223 RepID=A0A1I3MP61_9BACL|nr:SPFH domain / Band 7 family protein [Thermoflavimicrobium dichotomicum]